MLELYYFVDVYIYIYREREREREKLKSIDFSFPNTIIRCKIITILFGVCLSQKLFI